jgi:phenylpropionate dioxygenase-like ring-hydroxylating dioxygenase large terminal subunit
MNQQLQQTLVRRCLAHIAERTTDREPAPSTLPVAAYADESLAVLSCRPVAVGHVSQLPTPGSFFTHDHAGMSLLVVRAQDGAIRAFKNVCRHRGTQVVQAPCGVAKAFVCPYHAWSYGLDGKLLGIPHGDGFVDPQRRLSIAAEGLAEVPVAVIAGMVFVRLDGQPIDPDYLGPLADHLVGFGLADGHIHDVRLMTRELSWKLGIDIFLEAYHFKQAHKDSIYRLFFDNIGTVDFVGPHQLTVVPKRTIKELSTQPPEQWKLRDHANVLFHLFPNTLILVQADHVGITHMWPAGPRRARLQMYMVVPETQEAMTDKGRAYWAANNEILMGAIEEDVALGESIQRGLACGANSHVTFGAFEHGLAHFHAEIAAITR